MIRGSLRRSNALDKSEELNPLEGTFNLVDAMLVFSCGLMVSIIINWGVKLSPVTLNSLEKQELKDDIEQTSDEIVNVTQGDSYEEMGMVYRDHKTGKLYLMSEKEPIE